MSGEGAGEADPTSPRTTQDGGWPGLGVACPVSELAQHSAGNQTSLDSASRTRWVPNGSQSESAPREKPEPLSFTQREHTWRFLSARGIGFARDGREGSVGVTSSRGGPTALASVFPHFAVTFGSDAASSLCPVSAFVAVDVKCSLLPKKRENDAHTYQGEVFVAKKQKEEENYELTSWGRTSRLLNFLPH